ncbi:MAG TPA: ABC transporter permease [Chloroflexota bacterium]|jgi:ABC-type nitrate/sulfonate/bicarbonate transport system permease component
MAASLPSPAAAGEGQGEGTLGLSPPTWLGPEEQAGKAFWRDHRTGFTRTLVVVVVLGAWEGLVRSGTISPLFLSSPLTVAGWLARGVATGSIWPHILVSAQEAAIGFALAVLAGIPLGIAMGRVQFVRDTFEPFVMALYASPSVAFLPLLIIWLGIGLWSKVVLIFLGGVFAVIINTEAGVAHIDPRLVETARAFTASNRQVLIKVVIPAAIPFILAGLRQAVGRVLIMVVVAELYAATAGLGYLIFQGGAMYDTTQVFAGVTLLAGSGIALNQALRLLEQRVAPWLQTRDI